MSNALIWTEMGKITHQCVILAHIFRFSTCVTHYPCVKMTHVPVFTVNTLFNNYVNVIFQHTRIKKKWKRDGTRIMFWGRVHA